MADGLLMSKVIPSKVMKTTWVFAEPSIQTLLQEYDPEKIGKWMLFLDCVKVDENGLTELDSCWPRIVSLVEKEILIDAKCSTALSWSGQATGVIICYTDDYTNKHRVKLAAESIRKVVDYTQPLFYKPNSTTVKGHYRRSGDKAISIYQHSVNNEFFERDEFAQWHLVAFSKSTSP